MEKDRTNKNQSSEEQAGQDYLRVLSHQLKSPINAIQALLKTVSEGYTGDVNLQTRHVVDKAILRVDEARELIADLLDYQMYTQQEESGGEEYDIVALVRELFTRYSSVASEQNISLHFDVPSAFAIMIIGDRRAMEQALRNLIENAVKYTPTGGSVTIRVKTADNERSCHIMVVDTGYGIPENELEHIFRPFYRSFKHKSNISGTGLGLAIVKNIVTNHSGNIRVDSQPNSGTTFTVELPVSDIVRSESAGTPRKQVIIIGGVTAGPKTAARLRRMDEEIDITLIEKNKFLSYSGCGLPSYINGTVESPKELMTTADATVRDIDYFESIEKIKILNDTVALQIDRSKKAVKTKDLVNNTLSDISYDYVVLATGAKPNLPEAPGLQRHGVYTLHSLEDAEVIKTNLAGSDAQDVYIIGAGLVGISTAEALIRTGKRVTILEKRKQILIHLVDKDLAKKIENELKRKGIKIITDIELEKIDQNNAHLLLHTNRDTYMGDIIIVSTGVKPNTELAQQTGLEIGPSGGIKVNTFLQTSDESIYAIGDCAESVNVITGKHEYWPLGSISTKMGRIAADNIVGKETEFQGSLGTALFKIVDVNIARTGLTERDAFRNGFETVTAVTVGLDKAHYITTSENIVLKVIADRQTQRILGAQMFGKGEIAGRVGIFAAAISQGLTLEDFFKIDLGYSPPFNTPIDIVQTGCLVLKNKIDALVRTVSAEAFDRQRDNIDGVINVCPLSMYPKSTIPDSINIPLENLRFTDIPFKKSDRIILYSRTSSGAYIAYRYLSSIGYKDIFVLEGGFEFWDR